MNKKTDGNEKSSNLLFQITVTSNWMRFVKLAVKFSEQNCLLHESDGRLYFKTCKFIHPKQELKVGYSKEYSSRFGLKFLEPDENEILNDLDKWPCFECDSKFESFDLLQSHLMNEHDDDPSDSAGNQKVKAKRRKIRSKLSSRKVSGPTTVAACCYCSKVFSKLISLKRHTEYAHSFADTESRATTNTNSENGGKNFKCELCRRYFTSAERFDKHRLIHCTTAKDTTSLKCTFCPRRLLTPSALSMHIKTHIYKNRLFHCLFCPERFQWANEIMNHVPIHRVDGFYSCEHCKKVSSSVDLFLHGSKLKIISFLLNRNSKNIQWFASMYDHITRQYSIHVPTVGRSSNRFPN